jgi:fucose 4-O-acetylase-like acetyltransferase
MARKLLLLNGLATLSLPFYHAAAYGFSALFLWTDRYRAVSVPNFDALGSPAFLVLLAVRQLVAFGIPAFLFVAGFFIAFAARGDSLSPASPVITARIRKLAAPFLIWTLVIFTLLRKMPSGVEEVLTMYYFIPLLVQFYLLAGLIVLAARRAPFLFLVAAAGLQLALEGARYAQVLGVDTILIQQLIRWTPIWFFPGRLFYFVMGVVVSLQLDRLSPALKRHRVTLALATLLMALLSFLEVALVSRAAGDGWAGPTFSGLARQAYAVLFVLMFVAFDRVRLPASRFLTDLGGKSLGVYLVNTPSIYVAASIMYGLAPWALGQQWVYQFVLITVGLAAPLALMALFSRSPGRRAYVYLFG